MRHKLSSVLWGLAFIIAGVGFAGNSLDWWDFHLFFAGWWTLFIIIPCAISILENGFRTANSIGLLVGVILLLSEQHVIDNHIVGKLLWPVVLILIGLSIILGGSGRKHKISATINHDNAKGKPEYTTIFSKQEVNFSQEVFPGANLTSIFGGFSVNLSGAYVEKDVVIDITTIFGGVEVIVPPNVTVVVSSTPIFGGVSNHTRQNKSENSPVIYINATCIFGGVDIR